MASHILTAVHRTACVHIKKCWVYITNHSNDTTEAVKDLLKHTAALDVPEERILSVTD